MKTHLDLFAGIGGFSIAAHWAGYTTIQFCEIEPFCQQLLSERFPGVPLHNDITTFDGRPLAGRIDLLTGGFPCQDISAAGKGEGLGGKRSGLWFELLRVIKECRPDRIVIENVPALRVRGADTVLAGLEEAGYTCWPVVVGADNIGAPHTRTRVWIIGVSPQCLADARHWGGRRHQERNTDTSKRPPCADSIAGPSQDVVDTKSDQNNIGESGNVGAEAQCWQRCDCSTGDAGGAVVDTTCVRAGKQNDKTNAIANCRDSRQISCSRSIDVANAMQSRPSSVSIPAGQDRQWQQDGWPVATGAPSQRVANTESKYDNGRVRPRRRLARYPNGGGTMANTNRAGCREQCWTQPVSAKQPAIECIRSGVDDGQQQFIVGLFPPGREDMEGWAGEHPQYWPVELEICGEVDGIPGWVVRQQVGR